MFVVMLESHNLYAEIIARLIDPAQAQKASMEHVKYIQIF